MMTVTRKSVCTSLALIACGLLAVSGMAIVASTTRAVAARTVTDEVPQYDVRNLRVGMSLAELPRDGYVGLACADDAHKALKSWQDYSQCAPDAHGRVGVSFKFDERSNVLASLDGKYKGTKVGGHPVLLTLFIGSDRTVVGLHIRTDPKARLYLRKKAFLLGRQAMSFYGNQGWNCSDLKASEDEAPIGETFIKERCEKSVANRHVVVERRLYRHANEALKAFVSASEVSVERAVQQSAKEGEK